MLSRIIIGVKKILIYQIHLNLQDARKLVSYGISIIEGGVRCQLIIQFNVVLRSKVIPEPPQSTEIVSNPNSSVNINGVGGLNIRTGQGLRWGNRPFMDSF